MRISADVGLKYPKTRFAFIFLLGVLASSVLLEMHLVNEKVIAPFTTMLAYLSSMVLNVFGMGTSVAGSVIAGTEGFSINILNGCNGVYITSILAAAVMAFPSTWMEKLVGLALGCLTIQLINLVRIVSLYWIGLNKPRLFTQFHLYIWQSVVIIISMGVWVYWAEALVGRIQPVPARK